MSFHVLTGRVQIGNKDRRRNACNLSILSAEVGKINSEPSSIAHLIAQVLLWRIEIHANFNFSTSPAP